jgi:hypothetical protein
LVGLPEGNRRGLVNSSDKQDDTPKKKTNKQIESDILFENPEIPSTRENMWNFLLLPVVIYAGFGRAIYVTERKKNLLQIAHAQEIFLHSLPLGMLVIYNYYSIEKKGQLDIACIVLTSLNFFQVFVEITILQVYQVKGVNLELRPVSKSKTRLDDLSRVTIVSIISCAITVLMGMYVFSNEGCVQGYFEENNICRDCSEFVNPQCKICTERVSCQECNPGYYAIDNVCHPCTGKFGENCKECNSSGCLVCDDTYFVSYG